VIRKRYALYTFDELAPAAREKVLERERHINVEGEWYDHVLDEWKGRLEGLGYEEPRIFFSGFGSQGDGACFEARVNLEAWLKQHGLGRKCGRLGRAFRDGEVEIRLRHSGHYYHPYSTDVEDHYSGPDDEVARELEEAKALIESEKVELSRDIYRELEDDYFALTSDEAVTETLRINDYLFHGDGCLAHA